MKNLKQKTALGPRKKLGNYKQKLRQINKSWSADSYETVARSYIKILPKILNAERCSIFVVDSKSGLISSIFGTGIENKPITAPQKGSIVGKVIETGKSFIEEGLDKKNGFHSKVEKETQFHTQNLICVPLTSVDNKKTIGAIQVLNKKKNASFTRSDLNLLEEISDHLAMTIENIMINQEIFKLSGMIEQELDTYRKIFVNGVPVIAASKPMRQILDTVRMVSKTPINIHIEGENGTGKELIAKLIHEKGPNKKGPFIAVNCAAIPETLFESEFFGYEKGAFTGADSSRGGYLEEANGGTLFLDEVADMPLGIQPKLLRAIQEKESIRLGSTKIRHYDFRILSASNRNFEDEVTKGRFREDLYFRLFSVKILIPPLRDRTDDIIVLAGTVLEDTCAKFNKTIEGFSPEVMVLFENYRWPGNVRQLQREIERLVALSRDGTVITPAQCSPEILQKTGTKNQFIKEGTYSIPDHIEIIEKILIQKALADCKGVKKKAAELLEITRQSLYHKLKKYNIKSTTL